MLRQTFSAFPQGDGGPLENRDCPRLGTENTVVDIRPFMPLESIGNWHQMADEACQPSVNFVKVTSSL